MIIFKSGWLFLHSKGRAPFSLKFFIIRGLLVSWKTVPCPINREIIDITSWNIISFCTHYWIIIFSMRPGFSFRFLLDCKIRLLLFSFDFANFTFLLFKETFLNIDFLRKLQISYIRLILYLRLSQLLLIWFAIVCFDIFHFLL